MSYILIFIKVKSPIFISLSYEILSYKVIDNVKVVNGDY